jgi:3-dehydroquinate synthase
MEVAAGEEQKNLQQAERLWHELRQANADRNTGWINVGGGMVCDLGGFVASNYQRGIPLVHIPTTLLAQVDAALGGKTAVNLGHWKNQVGTYYLPEAVLLDSSMLNELPAEEVYNGKAEMFKHGLIEDNGIIEYLGKLPPEALPGTGWIRRAAGVKMYWASADPHDQSNRKLLNTGHTVAHALEAWYLRQGQSVAHGQALWAGLIAEGWLAIRAGLVSEEDASGWMSKIPRFVTPRIWPKTAEWIPWMAGDKKNKSGLIGFSLPAGPGNCYINQYFSPREVGVLLRRFDFNTWLN